MLALRDFVVPHLNYVPYIEKPPLLYWLSAFFFKVFGFSDFVARLTPALSALGGLLATFFFVHRVFDRRRAILAAAVLATAPIYAIMAQILTTDMLLTLFVTVALYALYLHYLEGGAWCWVAYVAMALGTLTKGPLGIGLPIVSMAVFLWWQGELRGAVRRFHGVAGGLLVLAIAAPWFMMISLRLPSFPDFFFVGEYLRRFFQRGYSHHEPIYFYIPVILGGFLPWSVMVPFLNWRGTPANPVRRFCIASAGTIFVVFSLASAKLIPYVLPAFPPLAILIADGLASSAWPDTEAVKGLRARVSGILTAAGPLVSLGGVVAIGVAIFAPLFRTPYPMQVRPSLYGVGAVLIAGGAAMTLAFLVRKTEAGLAILVLTLGAGLMTGTYGRLEATPLRSYAALSREINQRVPQDATIISYRRYVQGLAFYTRRRIILVGPESELTYGAHHSKDANKYFLKKPRQMLRLWERPHPTVIVIDASQLARLKHKLGSFTLIASENTKRAILNRD